MWLHQLRARCVVEGVRDVHQGTCGRHDILLHVAHVKRLRRVILTLPQGEKMRQKRLNALTLSFLYLILYDVGKMHREIDEKRKEAARKCPALKEERREYRVRAIEVECLGTSFFHSLCLSLSLTPFVPLRLHFVRCWIETV